jgi:uncharacterized protein YbcI
MIDEALRNDQKTALAAALGDLWERAHGVPAGKVHVLAGPDSIVVLIKDALSPAERAAAQRTEGQALVQRYAEQLLGTIQPDLRAQVETITGRQAIPTSQHADTIAGHVLCYYDLGERLMLPSVPDSGA